MNPHQHNRLEIPVTVNYLGIFNLLSGFIQAATHWTADSADQRVWGYFRIPYRTSGTLDVPKLPDISVDSFKIERLSFTGASLRLSLGMNNPNAFTMPMDGLEYAALFGEVELTKGMARQVAPLTVNGRSTMDIDVNLNCSGAG